MAVWLIMHAVNKIDILKRPFYFTISDLQRIGMACSDGLHGVVSEARVEEVLNAPSGLEEMCRTLLEAAHAAGSPDNVTVLLIRAA